MDKEIFNELESNLREAVRIARGRAAPKTAYVLVTSTQIKAMRQRLDMSQAVFARTFHLSLDTVKGWEQGKRSPDAAACNYLRVIQANPEFVRKSLVA